MEANSNQALVEVATVDEDGDARSVTILLACGHRSHEMSVASSTFDFPADPVECPVCMDLRQMDLTLQIELMNEAQS